MSIHESTYGRRRDRDGDGASDRPGGADRHGRHLRRQTEPSSRESDDDSPEDTLAKVAVGDATSGVVVKTDRTNGAETRAVVTTGGGSETAASALERSGSDSEPTDSDSTVGPAAAHNCMQSRIGLRPTGSEDGYVGRTPSEIAANRIRMNGGGATDYVDGSASHPSVAQASGYLAPD